MKKKISLPNVILLGAQKAGTTSLYNWLGQHPDVFAPESMKDYGFFDNPENLQFGINWFGKSFNQHNTEKIILHGHVNYIFHAEFSASNIYQFNKDIKLLLILRNPIDRSYSAYWDARKVARESITNFEEAIKKEEERLSSNDFYTLSSLTYLAHGYYSKQIKEYLKYFSRDQIKILFFEDMKKKPEMVVKDVFSFLEIDADFGPNFDKKNLSGIPRSVLLQKFFQRLKVPRSLKRLFPGKYTGSIKRQLIRNLNVKSFTYPKMNPQTRKQLIIQFRTEIDLLEKLLNVNLNHWRS